jgi:hypothetical protein
MKICLSNSHVVPSVHKYGAVLMFAVQACECIAVLFIIRDTEWTASYLTKKQWIC